MLKQDILKATETEIFLTLDSSKNGLDEAEVVSRLLKYGQNRLAAHKISPFRVLLSQFQSSLIYILIVAAVISFAIKDFPDGVIILVILFVNTLIGFLQQYKSEKIIEKLSSFISSQTRVKRGGKMTLVGESEIVPGDIITVMEGDISPADIRLFEAINLLINESELTGESVPISKQVKKDGKTDTDCLVFAGSIIEKGKGIGIVYATGNNSELGIIATLSTQTQRVTQYEKSIQSFSSVLIKIVTIGLAVIFIIKIILPGGLSHFSELLIFILAMAVAVVPELLPTITTISLSSGALKLAKKNVVVKRLSSIEDLGNVDLLCTDKTGTITENKMVINAINSKNPQLFQQLAYATVVILKTRKRRTQSSYDSAFINYIPSEIKVEAKYLTIMKELPFDPEERRRRVVLQDSETKKAYLVVIGAPETLLNITHDNNTSTYLNDIAAAEKNGLHHLALAYTEIEYSPEFDILKNEPKVTFLGYVSMLDPLRASSKVTIEQAQKLGIAVKILTGDSKDVAGYIGRQINLVKDEEKVYTGDELETLPRPDYELAVKNCNVFARVSPVQKFNIIKALKETYIVAYQGDGINDAPALKLADVAIAVNTATDIAKENADIVLLNKSLEVIINGITYGRALFININKYIKHTMVSNFGNFLALSILYLVSTNLPLLPIQVLLITVISDLPLITIYNDTVETNEVNRPEKHNLKDMFILTLILGIPAAFFELGYFLMIRLGQPKVVETSLYVFITFIGLVVFYSIRIKTNFWKAKPSTKIINLSFSLAFVFSFIIIYIPVFQRWFSFVALPFPAVLLLLGLTVIYFLITDFIKVLYYKYENKIFPNSILVKA